MIKKRDEVAIEFFKHEMLVHFKPGVHGELTIKFVDGMPLSFKFTTGNRLEDAPWFRGLDKT